MSFSYTRLVDTRRQVMGTLQVEVNSRTMRQVANEAIAPRPLEPTATAINVDTYTSLIDQFVANFTDYLADIFGTLQTVVGDESTPNTILYCANNLLRMVAGLSNTQIVYLAQGATTTYSRCSLPNLATELFAPMIDALETFTGGLTVYCRENGVHLSPEFAELYYNVRRTYPAGIYFSPAIDPIFTCQLSTPRDFIFPSQEIDTLKYAGGYFKIATLTSFDTRTTLEFECKKTLYEGYTSKVLTLTRTVVIPAGTESGETFYIGTKPLDFFYDVKLISRAGGTTGNKFKVIVYRER